MVRKSLYDSNDVNKGTGVDDVEVSFYKIQKEVMYVEVTKVQECFKKAFLIQVTMQEVTISGTYISKNFKWD